jgi:hypothetical protein
MYHCTTYLVFFLKKKKINLGWQTNYHPQLEKLTVAKKVKIPLPHYCVKVIDQPPMAITTIIYHTLHCGEYVSVIRFAGLES